MGRGDAEETPRLQRRHAHARLAPPRERLPRLSLSARIRDDAGCREVIASRDDCPVAEFSKCSLDTMRLGALAAVLAVDTMRLGALAAVLAGARANKKPNILFVAVDDLRAEEALGPDASTPRLDEFRKEAVTFHNAHVQQAVCSPSRTSLLFGRRPDSTHVYDL